MKRFWGLVLVLFLSVSWLPAQEVSEKKEIAIFALGYSDWSIPDGALGMVDQSIQNVFVSLNRFKVIGMRYRLKASDVGAFIDEIKKVKSADMKIPEGVRLGEQTFTEADFNRLAGSFIIVVPVVSYYNVKTGDGGYAAELETSFTFINVAEGRAMASFQIRTSGTDDTVKGAVRSAVDGIPLQLTYEIRKIPEFQLKTGIIDFMGRDAVLELGRNMGVQPGDEYRLTTEVVLPSGRTVQRNAGLLVVKAVYDEVSTAQFFYSYRRPVIGDQLVEIPRLGFETSFYADYIESASPVLAMGFRQTAARGFFSFRPFLGMEVPVGSNDDIFGLFPLNVYIGGEVNWYLGRLHITPSSDVSVGMLIPVIDADEFDDVVIYSSIGGHARLTVSYMVSDSVKIFVDGGYAAMLAVSDWFDEYYGLFTGAGLTIKY